MNQNDSSLLRAWVAERSEPAFSRLVERHLPLVYNAARRQVGEDDLAREIAHVVFVVLAGKASRLDSDLILPGWLFRTTRFVAMRALRDRARQRRRDQEAYAMAQLRRPTPENETGWEDVAPHIDAALDSLSETDRNAVLLRYFDKQPIREVGIRLGMGEEAAKKRLQRALDKVRQFLTRKGIAIGMTALGLLLANLPVSAVPAGLAASVSGSAFRAREVSASALTRAALPESRVWPVVAVALLLLLTSVTMIGLQSTSRTHREGRDAADLKQPGTLLAKITQAGIPGLGRHRNTILISLRAAEDEHPVPGALSRLVAIGENGAEIEVRNIAGDSSGVIEIPLKTVDFQRLEVEIEAPARIPVIATWSRHEFIEPILTEIVRLKKGVSVHGRILARSSPVKEPGTNSVGEDGFLGVSKAKVHLHYYHPWTEGRIQEGSRHGWEAITDSKGAFVFPVLPVRWHQQGIVRSVVAAEGYIGSESYLSSWAGDANDLTWELAPGLVVRGKVISRATGKPVPAARVSAVEGGTTNVTQTDSLGRFALGWFPVGSKILEIKAPGFTASRFLTRVSENNDEVMLELRDDEPETSTAIATAPVSDPITVAGTVVDAKTGDPLPVFEVLQSGAYVSMALLGRGQAGRFKWTIMVPPDQWPSLTFAAEGYSAYRANPEEVARESQSLTVRLTKRPRWLGQVLAPDGKPARDARGSFSTSNPYLDPQTGVFSFEAVAAEFQTDENGNFAVTTPGEGLVLYVSHPSGFAVIDSRYRNQRLPTALFLEPWASLTGRFVDNPAHRRVDAITITGLEDIGPVTHIDPIDMRISAEGSFHWRYLPGDSRIMFSRTDQSGLIHDMGESQLEAGRVSEVELRGP